MIPPSMMRCADGPVRHVLRRSGAESGPIRHESAAIPARSAVIMRGCGADAAEYLRMFLHQQEQPFNSAAYDFVSSRQYTA
ncbi:hypothetical protein TSH100_25635 [Azospirillum sp. TSH100]|nr:hypothetical protein TSH100_25635 [Azospirillum sp. TSH100]